MKKYSSFKRNGSYLAKFIIAIIAIYYIYKEGARQLKRYDFKQVVGLLHSIDTSRIFLLLILGLIAVSIMTVYDYFLLKHIKYNIPLRKVWRISWIANSFNNFLSFAGLTGASLRTFLYKKYGVSTKEAIYASAMMAPSTVIGISTASWLIIFNVFEVKPVLRHYRFLVLGLIGFALYLILYILIYEWEWLNKKVMSKLDENENRLKELRWKLVSASMMEWVLISLFFFYVCTIFSKEIVFSEAVGIIILSSIGGIMSFVPGGMGSFDLICLTGLEAMGSNSHRAMAILITYRFFYYIVPWLLGVVLGVAEIIHRKDYKTT